MIFIDVCEEIPGWQKAQTSSSGRNVKPQTRRNKQVIETHWGNTGQWKRCGREKVLAPCLPEPLQCPG